MSIWAILAIVFLVLIAIGLTLLIVIYRRFGGVAEEMGKTAVKESFDLIRTVSSKVSNNKSTYIYNDLDNIRFEEHVRKQKELSPDFQQSYDTVLEIKTYKKLISSLENDFGNDATKDVRDFLTKYIHDLS